MGAENMDRPVGYLRELSEARGAPGNEGEVRAIILDAIRPFVDETRVDTIGNLIALRKARTQSSRPVPRKVMVDAHMDEVSLMISSIDGSGLLRFWPVGVIPQLLLSKKVLVGEKKLPGVIGSKPIHLTTPEERSHVVQAEQMTIDIGATSKGQAEGLVSIGEFATFDTKFVDLGDRVRGKAFDDRAGCAVLIELLKADYPFDLYGVFTVQEEVGLRGARVSAFAVEPDAAIALEGTICDELPHKGDLPTVTKLDQGPVITIMDQAFIAHPGFLAHMIHTAETKGILYQIKQPGKGGTDAGAIHITKAGIPSTAVSVASRYIHAPTAILSKADFQNTVRLVRETLQGLTADVLETR
jgi:tetrahedral aminopeptidase